MIILIVIAVIVLVLLIILFSLTGSNTKSKSPFISYSIIPYNSSNYISTSSNHISSSPQLQNTLSDNIKILTYNLNYKGVQDNNNECGGKDTSYKSVNCMDNIKKIIKKVLPIDFICLQEVSKFSSSSYIASIIKKNYNFKEWKPHDNRLVTIWNIKKYGDCKFYMFGRLASYKKSSDNIKYDPGRLYQLFLFDNKTTNQKICLINIHQGHFEEKKTNTKKNILINTDINTTTTLKSLTLIEKIIKDDFEFKGTSRTDKFGTNPSIVGSQIQTLKKSESDTTKLYDIISKDYRIIIAGDFNCNFKKFKIFNKDFKNKNPELKTCCYNKSKDDILEYSSDHILDSYNSYEIDEYIQDFEWPASDHAPIVAVLNNTQINSI
jgi:endonuclease/exonuclease/phosphatase family metal-dependent hydrolase